MGLAGGSSCVCTHPIADRQWDPENRHIKRIDVFEHTYSFRITVAKREELERMAMEFNKKPVAQNVFPAVLCASAEREKDGFVIRLMNNDRVAAKTKVQIGEETTELTFGAYEVKRILCRTGEFEECKELLI